MNAITTLIKKYVKPEQIFMLSVLVVNGGNYLYNLLLGRILGPEKFADAAILVTFLLVLSFIAMTFQLVTAKFSVLFEGKVFKNFISLVYKNALWFSVLMSFLIVFFSKELQSFFNTSSSNMFVIFGLGIPFYFFMSVNRGVFQGKKELSSLSFTYQTEMISRLIITFAILYLLDLDSSVIIAIGIFLFFYIWTFSF